MNTNKLVFESLKQYLSNINEEDEKVENKGTAEKSGSAENDPKLDDFIKGLGEEIAKGFVVKTTELKKKQDAKKGNTNESFDPSKSLNESLLLMGVSAILASPKIMELIAKLVRYVAKKFKSTKGENLANNIKHFAHKMHKLIHTPVEWIGKKLGLKTWSLEKYEKGEKQGLTAERFSEIVIGVVISALLVVSGVGLAKALTHLESVHIVSEGALVAIKSKEITEIISKIASSAKV